MRPSTPYRAPSPVSQPFHGAHFATMPEALVVPCLLAGSPPGAVVLDPFGGSGTVGAVAMKRQRRAVLIELNPTYAVMARARIADAEGPLLASVKPCAASAVVQ